jgi:hypothetical protein
MLKKALAILKKNSLAVSLVLLGSFVWSLTMVKSGIVYDYGMGFWGPNGHDGIWHIALIKSLSQGSWQMPVFAGEALKNYHLGFDLILAWISKLSGINPITLYFQITPPILAVLIGIFSYKLVIDWRGSKAQAFWALFFVYFGGSLGWIVNLVRKGSLDGESMFWAQQGISTLVNPPYALSLVILLLGLIVLGRYLRKPLPVYLLSSIFLFGILIQIKAYAGILSLAGLFLAGVVRFLRHKKYDILLVSLGSFLLSILLFLPLNKGARGLLVFQPFWFLETMMGLSDRVGWERFYSAMTNYRAGGIWFKAIPAYFVAFLIFWLGNLGTRMVKAVLVLGWLKKPRSLQWLEIFFLVVIVAGLGIPLFFLQKGTPWNTIQFVYYSLFVSGILAGVALGQLLQRLNPKSSLIIGSLMVLLTIPTTIGTLGHYLPQRPPAMVSGQELEALDFLSRQPAGVVLTYPYDTLKAKEAEANPPRPLHLYESTAYVSALSGKVVYLEDQVNLDITGYGWRERRDEVEGFLQSSDLTLVRNYPRQRKIRYVYWLRGQRAKVGEEQIGMERIFENSMVSLYQITDNE